MLSEQGVVAGKFLGAHWPVSLTKLVNSRSNQRLCLKRKKITIKEGIWHPTLFPHTDEDHTRTPHTEAADMGHLQIVLACQLLVSGVNSASIDWLARPYREWSCHPNAIGSAVSARMFSILSNLCWFLSVHTQCKLPDSFSINSSREQDQFMLSVIYGADWFMVFESNWSSLTAFVLGIAI